MPDRLARWISVLFDSSILSLPVFCAFGWLAAGTAGLAWAGFVLLIVTGIPLAYLMLGKGLGWVSDLEMTQRSERPRFILISLSSDLLALTVLCLFHGPPLLRVMALTYLCLGATMFTISSFWKISLHMVGVSGFATALVFVFGAPALIAFLSLPLVAWARWHRRKHTIPQLITGALAGGIITALVFGFSGQFIQEIQVKHTLLVVTAHPDDESFPMGGTLAEYAAEGARVVLVSATRGEAGLPGIGAAETARIREAELRAAARTLGVAWVEFLDYVDGRLSQADPQEVIDRLTGLLEEERPDAVITFGRDGISGHPDHVAVHQLVTQAFERAHLPARLFYLVPSEATQQGCGIPPSKETDSGPAAAIDIGAYRVTKVRAMQCHASQKPPYPGNPEEEAEKLACHEHFVLARPRVGLGDLTDIFE